MVLECASCNLCCVSKQILVKRIKNKSYCSLNENFLDIINYYKIPLKNRQTLSEQKLISASAKN